MTYEEFKQAAIDVADGNSVFIDENCLRGDDVWESTMAIVYENKDFGEKECLRTKTYSGETRYQDCLMDMKLQIFNRKKKSANTNAWRNENEAAA